MTTKVNKIFIFVVITEVKEMMEMNQKNLET